MVKLEKVIGLTTLSNASIATAISGSDTFYAAGSCVVRYNITECGQKSFYKASNAVACLAISLDGRYLAVGERGQAPNIIIWNISSGDQHNIASSHKHGIGCIAFSPDGRYLVSVGFRHDRQLIVWELKSRQRVNIQKVGRKVNSIAMSSDGSFFVTCGKQHLKWWYLDHTKDVHGSLKVVGKPASILTKYDDAIFMDVKIAKDNSVYSTSSSGLLCIFDENRMMKTFVQVDSLVTYSLVLLDYAQCTSNPEKKQNLILVGCSEGLIRIFSAQSLKFKGNLPLPTTPVKGENIVNKFSACLALSTVLADSQQKVKGPFVAASPLKLISIHADRSMIIWNISNIDNISQHSVFVHHNACIWDLSFVPISPLYPSGVFATCSADGSLRIWQDDALDQNLRPQTSVAESAVLPTSNTIMTGVIRVIGDSKTNTTECTMIRAASGIKSTDSDTSGESYPHADSSTASTVSTSLTRTIADVAIGLTRSLTDPYTGIYDLELPDRPQIPHAPRAFAVHPSGLELVCGDKSGLLKIYSLSPLILTQHTQAHSSEILTIHYSPFLYPNGNGFWSADSLGASESISIVLLASAGRDRLIHIFNASDDYKLVVTLDRHTSPVTAVKFTPDGTRLLSCGSDHNIIFYDVNGITITHVKNVMTPYSTINGLAVEATSKFGITTGQVEHQYYNSNL